MTAPIDKEKPPEQTGPKPGKKPEGIYRLLMDGQPQRSVAVVSSSTIGELKTRLVQIIYGLRGVNPANIRLFVDKREIADGAEVRQVVPDGATIRVEVKKDVR